MTHHEIPNKDAALRWFVRNERICIGWGTIGDIRSHGYGSSIAVNRAIRHQFDLGNHPFSNFKSGGDSLWGLYGEMKKGDLVIVKGATYAEVMKVEGEYEFRDAPSQVPFPDYFHQRRAVVQNHMDPQKLWNLADGAAKDGGSIYRTLIRCVEQVESS